MGWTYHDVLALPEDVYLQTLELVNEINAPRE